MGPSGSPCVLRLVPRRRRVSATRRPVSLVRKRSNSRSPYFNHVVRRVWRLPGRVSGLVRARRRVSKKSRLDARGADTVPSSVCGSSLSIATTNQSPPTDQIHRPTTSRRPLLQPRSQPVPSASQSSCPRAPAPSATSPWPAPAPPGRPTPPATPPRACRRRWRCIRSTTASAPSRRRPSTCRACGWAAPPRRTSV